MMRLGLCLVLAMVLSGAVSAGTVWHCSRIPVIDVAIDNRLDPGDVFNLAGNNGVDDVIRISVRDLIDVYSGISVRLSGVPLSACFMPANDAQTVSALRALGLSEDVFSALARNSAITKNHLYRVTDEAEMRACIQRHQPAVGYLKQTQITEHVAPCF